jgi:hypothetical protein
MKFVADHAALCGDLKRISPSALGRLVRDSATRSLLALPLSAAAG